MLWEELRQDEFLDAVLESKGVCVLPIGCVEAHGIHMPLACDVMHVYGANLTVSKLIDGDLSFSGEVAKAEREKI